MSKVVNSVTEKSSRSHGKKSDKETHTPMLKIFKDMMQLEKNDPEKTNLLNEKERHKKKKHYSSSRTKTDYINRTCNSSSSERNGDCEQVMDGRQYDIHTLKTPFAKLTNKTKKSKESKDTSSCGSCALKRLATSEYACLVCLGVIFAITIIVAFCMVFKSPTNIPCPPEKPALKRHTIFKGVNYADISLKDGLEEDRNDWDDSHLGRFHEMSELPDLDDSNSRGLSYGGASNQFSDLSKIIDINKLNYGKSSERLKSERSSEYSKNFYKKLLQADDQIKNLKKGYSDSSITLKNTERMKRSLKHHPIHNEVNDDHNKRRNRHNRYKRNDSLSPTSLVIEKKKLMVVYPQSETRKVAKCSHTPKESKSHETKLKHPFYKHTERLDELLDQFLDKNIPKILSNPFGMDMFNHDDKATTGNKVTRTTTNSHANHKNVVIMDSFSDKTDTYRPDNSLFRISSTDKSDSDVILGVTTIMSSPKSYQTTPLVDILPNIRKLMQVNEPDEEALGYEDLKEVLADDESSEAPEVKFDRSKRALQSNTESNPVFEINKGNPSGIPIPNWKGPLPLYPDELNTMIKHENANKGTASEIARTVNQPIFNDVEYVEDYLSNKYEKLAQAYSDYGVLDEKKAMKIENQNADKVNLEQKTSVEASKRGMRNMSFKKKKLADFAKIFDNHVKYISEKEFKPFSRPDNSYAGFKLKYTHPCQNSKEGIHFCIIKDISESPVKRDKQLKPDDNNTLDNMVTIKKRTLKSIEMPKILNSDLITVKMGLDNDSKGEDNLLTIGYSFGEEDNEIKFGTTSPKIDTEQTHFHNYLFGHLGIKQRSLKSIEIDNTDDETVGLIENVTIDDSSPVIVTTEALTIKTLKETSHDEEDAKANEDPELVTKINESLVIKHEITDQITSPKSMPETLNNSRMDFNLDIAAKKTVNDLVNLVNLRNDTDASKDGMDLSDLFRLFSNWFKRLSSVSLDNNDNHSETNSSIMVIKSSEAPSITVSDLKNISDIMYPNYDSEMIDNIGHRSRVLMSVDEANNVTKDDKGNGDADNDKIKSDIKITNSTDPPDNILTTIKYESDANTLERDKTDAENKTIVKRSLTDSGLVFWSDLYDDEYGVKVDNMEKEKEIDDKNTPKGKEFMKRSRNWIKDKVRSIAENIKELRSDGMKKVTSYDSHVYKRQVKEKPVDTQEKETSFAELKVKMRNVCKEAAKAVQQTRKMQARESQEDTAANSIMQQLVRMMSDLVDYQVKQKTCIKLPEDLQNFLEWLTTPEDQSQRSSQDAVQIDERNILGNVKDWETPTVTDEKAEYLESLRLVEELIQQYGQMNDEEKSKMSGVREYLENQQDFLTKQIALLDELHFSNLYASQQPIRIKRRTVTETPKLERDKKRKFGRLGKLRIFGKTSTTVTIDEATERKNEMIDNEIKHSNNDYDRNRNNDDFNFIVESNHRDVKKGIQDYNNVNQFDADFNNLDKEFSDDSKIDKGDGRSGRKRNLQDVYYKAVYDAKRVITEKNIDSSNYKLGN